MLTFIAALALAQAPTDEWRAKEAVHLTNIKQITNDFARAGDIESALDARRAADAVCDELSAD